MNEVNAADARALDVRINTTTVTDRRPEETHYVMDDGSDGPAGCFEFLKKQLKISWSRKSASN